MIECSSQLFKMFSIFFFELWNFFLKQFLFLVLFMAFSLQAFFLSHSLSRALSLAGEEELLFLRCNCFCFCFNSSVFAIEFLFKLCFFSFQFNGAIFPSGNGWRWTWPLLHHQCPSAQFTFINVEWSIFHSKTFVRNISWRWHNEAKNKAFWLKSKSKINIVSLWKMARDSINKSIVYKHYA